MSGASFHGASGYSALEVESVDAIDASKTPDNITPFVDPVELNSPYSEWDVYAIGEYLKESFVSEFAAAQDFVTTHGRPFRIILRAGEPQIQAVFTSPHLNAFEITFYDARWGMGIKEHPSILPPEPEGSCLIAAIALLWAFRLHLQRKDLPCEGAAQIEYILEDKRYVRQ
jgi:hypothetical protein